MRTMFKVMRRLHDGDFVQYGDFVDKIEDCKELTSSIVPNLISTGDYRVVKVTMDEATFTMKEEVVVNYDFQSRCGRFVTAKKIIAMMTAEKLEHEARRRHLRSADVIALCDREIAKCEREIQYAYKVLEKEMEYGVPEIELKLLARE